MKYLFKYNESNYDTTIHDFITDCFIELTDNDSFVIRHSDYTSIVYDYFNFAIPDGLNKLNSIDKYLNDLDKTKNIMEDIQVAIKRILEKFPDIFYLIEYDDGTYRGEVMDIPKISIYFRDLNEININK